MDKFSSSLAAATLVDGQHFTLPGHGTLEGVYVAAQINHVAREVSPPSLKVTWASPPLPGAQTFAELLVNTGATTEEAVTTQDAWLDALERGERVEVGDLGYVALDGGDGAARWVSNPEALARVYWSSGAVPVEPLAKPRPEAPAQDRNSVSGNAASAKTASATTASATTASATTASAEAVLTEPALSLANRATAIDDSGDPAEPPGLHVAHRAGASGRSKLLRYAALFAVVLLGLAALRSFGARERTPDEDAVAVTISNDRLNRSPLDASGAPASVLADGYEEPAFKADLGPGTRADDASGFDPANLAGAGPAFDPATAAELTPASAGPDPVNPVPASGTRATATAPATYDDYDDEAYVVILGSFGNASNAKAMTERLLGDGYMPFVDQQGGLTRVGVTVETEGVRGVLTERLFELRERYGKGAWVME